MGVGGGDVDRVDLGVGEQVLVASVRPRGAALGRAAVVVEEALGLAFVPRADGHEGAGEGVRQADAERTRDVAGTEDAPAELATG
jgi:hypothetical protein